MSFTFRPAKRENVPLLLGLAGGTGSGKTFSALRLARGIAAGHPFAGIDTENGRMSIYADHFSELHVGEIAAPFRPATYAAAIEAAEGYLEQQNVPLANRAVVVDSASHEWAGDGGCLDWHDDLMGGDQAKNLSSWIEPKKAHKRMVTRLLQVKAHVILCFRAEPKVEAVKVDGRWQIVPKPSLTGLDGWLPISEKMLPYELTASFLLMADTPGIPRPIKLPGDLKPFVSLDHPIDEETGKLLAAWARGGAAGQAESLPGAVAPPAEQPTDQPRPLTSDEFKDAREREGISPQQAGVKARELWPDRTGGRLGDLTDAERGELWRALIEKQEALI